MRVLACALALLCGCTGEIHDASERAAPGSHHGGAASDPGETDDELGGDGDSDPDGGSRDPDDMTVDASECAPPPSRVVRLSKLELQHSVEDLLHTTRAPALPDDAKFLTFSPN